MSVKRKVKISFLNNLLILKDFFLTKSSLRIIYLFYSSKIKKRKKIRKYKKHKIQFQNSIKTLHHDSDWFSHNIPFWNKKVVNFPTTCRIRISQNSS